MRLWNSLGTHGNIQIENNMRTKTLLAAAAMLAAGLASSMAQSNVYSLNVVGYVNKTVLGANKYTAIANPLNTATNTLSSLLTGLPIGAQVLKYNASIADYDLHNKLPGNLWTGPGGGATTLNPGEGILVFITGSDVTNTFVGEVMQGNLVNQFASGYNQRGNMVPDSGLVSTLQLTNVPTGAQFLQWNTTTQDWDIHNKLPGTLWSGGEPNLQVGESFILYTTTAFDWVRNFTVQ